MAVMFSLPTSLPGTLVVTRPADLPCEAEREVHGQDDPLRLASVRRSITLPPLGWAQNVNDGKVCLISQDFGYIGCIPLQWHLYPHVRHAFHVLPDLQSRQEERRQTQPLASPARGARQRHLLNGMVKLQKRR